MGRTAQEATAAVGGGRPRKYKGEDTSTVSARIPDSVREHLERKQPKLTASSAAYEVILFEKDLSELLEPHILELRVNAANHGQDYAIDRAQTLARLIKAGLVAERKSKKAGQA